MEEIVDDMNVSGKRVIPSDNYEKIENPEKYSLFVRICGDALLDFGLDYIDRWVLYNNLFGKDV